MIAFLIAPRADMWKFCGSEAADEAVVGNAVKAVNKPDVKPADRPNVKTVLVTMRVLVRAAEDDESVEQIQKKLGRRYHTDALLIPESNDCLLALSRAINLETGGPRFLVGCATTDARDIGIVKVRGVRDRL
jgi:hypothetical protein